MCVHDGFEVDGVFIKGPSTGYVVDIGTLAAVEFVPGNQLGIKLQKFCK